MLKDYVLPPLSGGVPQKLVIFLHGLGDRGDGGLLSLGQVWGRALPTTEFVCPDAPFPFDMATPDMGGRQWFSLQDFNPARMQEGVRTAAPILNDYIDQSLVKRNLRANSLALVGFSQGTMMALYVAPRRAEPMACVIGYSGLLSGGENLKNEKKSSPPVLLVHGTADEVVPYSAMAEAERGLQEAKIPVTTLPCPDFGHSIDDRGVMQGLIFLKKYLG